MVLDLKVPFVRDRRQRAVDRRLGWSRDHEIRHRATRPADQMMMMTGQVLCQLEVPVLIGDDNAMDDASVDQLCEVPIGGAL